MAKLTLASSIRVGDLTTGIIVDSLELVSISINWQQATPVVSAMFRNSSGWTHTVTLTGKDGDAQWQAIKAAIPDFEKRIMTLMADKLPSGVIG